MINITIVCFNCKFAKNQYLNLAWNPNLITEFDSFSEAHRHMIEFPDHEMHFEIHNNDNEE